MLTWTSNTARRAHAIDCPSQTPHSSSSPLAQQYPSPSNTPLLQQAPCTSTALAGPSQTPHASTFPLVQQAECLSSAAPCKPPAMLLHHHCASTITGTNGKESSWFSMQG